jgi:hypothetical protein
MRIQTFNNGKGLIHGADDKRIGCDIEGILKISTIKISIKPDEESILPIFLNGCSGEYSASFTSIAGIKYDLGKVSIRGGRIAPPSQTAVELMELRCRVELLEARCEALEDQNRKLSNIFDTNSLNFLIK